MTVEKLGSKSLKARAASGAFWITLETMAVQGTAFAVFAVLAHFVSASDFGLISISFSLIFSLKFLILDNVVIAITRKAEASDIEYTTAFWITFAIGLLCTILLYSAADIAEWAFHAPGLALVLRPMSIIMLFSGLSRTHEGWLFRNFQFKTITIRSVAGITVGSIAGILLAVHGYGITALIVQQVTINLVGTAMLWISCPWRPGLRISRSATKEIIRFMRGITGNSVVNIINGNFDAFLVSWFFGPASVGIYSLAKRVKGALHMVTALPAASVAYSSLAEVQNDPERLRRVFLTGLTMLCILSAPAFLGTAAISHEAITVLFGQKWVQAAPVLEILSIGALIMVMLALNDSLFITHNKPVWTFYLGLAYSLLMIGVFIMCARWHMKALGLPFVLPYLVTFPASYALLCHKMGFKFQELLRAMTPGIGASLAMFAIVKLLDTRLEALSDAVRLVILCATGAIAYPAILWIFNRKATQAALDTGRQFINRRRQSATV